MYIQQIRTSCFTFYNTAHIPVLVDTFWKAKLDTHAACALLTY